jgi:CBS domain-containing protein
MKKVKDFMKKNVVCFSPEDPVFDVARVLAELNISGGPVVKEGKVVGIITLSDIIKYISMKSSKVFKFLEKVKEVANPGTSWFLLTLLEMGKDRIEFKKQMKKLNPTKIKEIMTKKVVTVTPDTTLIEAATLMEKHDVNRLPVVNESGKLVGIIARTDLIKAIVS